MVTADGLGGSSEREGRVAGLLQNPQVNLPVSQVGWPHKNMLAELLREPARVSLVLKKIPVPETPSQVPALPLHTCFQTLMVTSVTLFLVASQMAPDSPHLLSQSLPLNPLSPR